MPFAESGDCRLYFEDQGGGNVIVLVPGLGLSADAWGVIAGKLVGSHRVVSVDPRGAGRSDKPDERYTGPMVAADLASILDAAQIETAHVVGLSMGGMIAQEFAIRYPDRLKSLVLASTYAATDDWSRRIFEVRRMIIERIGLLEQFKLSVLTVTSPSTFRTKPEVVEGFERGLIDNLPDKSAYLRQLQYCMDHDTHDRLSAIRVPTLVVTGSDDILTSRFQGRELAEGIPGAEFREVPGGSHVFLFEEPDLFAQTVLEFIAGSPG